jgi:hypothetical protein
MRLVPAPGRGEALHAFFAALVDELPRRPGLTGAHLLRHDAPDIAATKEQAIRSHRDRSADLIAVVCGYDRAALEALQTGELGADRLAALGAEPDAQTALYTLACSATPGDVDLPAALRSP